MANTSKNKTTAKTKQAVAAAETDTGRSKKSRVRRVSVVVLLIVGIVIFGIIALFTTLAVLVHTSNVRASNAEYDFLRGLAGDIDIELDEHGDVRFNALDEEMRAINPDFVCWLRIDGTNIDYPVVRGVDNDKYLNTSFYGEDNIAGAIFMDYRNDGDKLPHIIIYGHNLQQGGMFTDLRRFLNKQFLEDNDTITLIVNGHPVEFEIFSARLSDIRDPAYNLNVNTSRLFARFATSVDAPLHATQIITLSTCTSSGGDNARLIVQGYR